MLIGRFPGVGVYFYMSVEVLKTLFFVFWVYLPVLIAFAIMFHLLLPSMDEFKNVGSSFTVLAMMTGELDYGDRFLYNSDDTLSLIAQTYVQKISFILSYFRYIFVSILGNDS